jgi:hypothetical protein
MVVLRGEAFGVRRQAKRDAALDEHSFEDEGMEVWKFCVF